MGIKFMGVLANGWRCGPEDKTIPPIFWWEDQAGKNRVLFWYWRAYRAYGLNEIWCDTQRQYPEGEFVFDETKARKTQRWLTEKLTALSGYAYDTFPLSFYDDREIPTTMLLTVCEEMNRRWKSPSFNMEIPSVVFEKIAARGGDSIPIFRGDITDQWADFATISPELTAKKRDVMRMLYDAEALCTMRSDDIPYPETSFTDVVWDLCCFDEHCWATSSKHPQKMHRSNIENVKRSPVERSHANLNAVLEQVCGFPTKKQLSIISTLPQKRSSSLRVDNCTPVPAGIAHQILPDGSVITAAMSFDGIEARIFDAAAPTSPSIQIHADRIETDHYVVRFSHNTQKILGITDKQSGRELLDASSRFELGQFIYTYSEDKLQPPTGYEVPKKLRFDLYEGDVAYVLVQTSYEEQSSAEVFAQFIFYKHEKNIDIDLGYKNAAGLIGDFYDRYKKNYFFAFPFALHAPEFFTELQAGEKNEKTDVISLNARDFTVTQNWLAAEEYDFGVAVYTRDMPVFHIGGIKYNHFSKTFDETDGHFFLYASSNRCNNLLYTSVEQCRAEYRLSVLPFCEKHSKVVPFWSCSKEHGLFAASPDIHLPGKVTVDKNNVQLVSLKKAHGCDDAVVLRFVETEGRSTECRLELFFPPVKAVYAANDEKNLAPVAFDGTVVRFTAPPYSYTTLKIYGHF